MKYTKLGVESAREMLHKFLQPGDTVYTVIRKVSTSGMSRKIDLYTFKDNRKIYLTGYAAVLLGYSRDIRSGALSVSGCGMDMGFHVVYSLSRVLFPDGFKLAEGQRGRNGDMSGYDNDGGYALRQEWI
jgi:hypothetical protein